MLKGNEAGNSVPNSSSYTISFYTVCWPSAILWYALLALGNLNKATSEEGTLVAKLWLRLLLSQISPNCGGTPIIRDLIFDIVKFCWSNTSTKSNIRILSAVQSESPFSNDASCLQRPGVNHTDDQGVSYFKYWPKCQALVPWVSASLVYCYLRSPHKIVGLCIAWWQAMCGTVGMGFLTDNRWVLVEETNSLETGVVLYKV